MEVVAVCHVHSGWSYDGSWPLEALSAKFRRRGCRVLMMTEHDRGFTASRFDEYRRACAQASSNEILVVPGIEYSDAGNRVHLLVWGPVPFLGENLPTGEMLEAVRANNGVAVFAHPSRKNSWECFETSWAKLILGVEVWNRKYDGWAPGEAAPALLRKADAVPFVGLDFHTQRQSFPLTMALNLQEAQVTEEAVLDALRSRHCAARAFGAPLSQDLLRKALPALRIAERSRRTAVSIVRRSGVLSR
jgi:hypothetical protein